MTPHLLTTDAAFNGSVLTRQAAGISVGFVRKRRRAFSVVEIMASLFVITAALFPAMLLCLGSYRTAQQAQAQTVAYLIAQKQIETVRLQSWGSRPTSGATAFTVSTTSNDQVMPNGTANTTVGFQGRYWVTPVSSSVQQITVRVSWPSLTAWGKVSEVCLDTLYVK